MEFWEDFDQVFAFERNAAYDPKLISRVEANRKSLENTLFVDRLLRALHIDNASQLYPPRENAGLRELHKQIVSSPYPAHQKQSLIYYILRDLIDQDIPSQFAERSFMPENYRLFVDGLWHLDRLEFQRALRYLTDPSLIPTFPDEILYTLCVAQGTCDSFANAYYLSTSPPLATEKTMDAYFAVLCRTSITDAFYFARKQPEPLRQQLLNSLITSVLAGRLARTRAERAAELVNLPFDRSEEEAFENFLLHGAGRQYAGSRDTVLMRRIAMGNLDGLATGLENVGGRSLEGVNWTSFKRNLQPASRLGSRML